MLDKVDLRQGRWQDVLADVTCDALICDPPYGAATHQGHNSATKQVFSATGQKTRTELVYQHWTPDDVREFVSFWSPRTSGWMVCFTSDDLIHVYREAFQAAGRLSFAPVVVIQPRPRLLGDGPASWATYLMVARPRTREYSTWGCLPGMYQYATEKHGVVAGAKPLNLMREIVRDYSRPDEIVLDPCAGGATTLLAAVAEGRFGVGAEVNPDTHAKAQDRLREALHMPLFEHQPTQTALNI